MEISKYTPDLTVAEAERFWMTPVGVCRLAAVGEPSDPKIKKLLNTLSDRGHVPFVKSGEAKTAPRLYSLVSAAMVRVIFDITRDGRTYVYAHAVAAEVARILLRAVKDVPNLATVDQLMHDDKLVFAEVKSDGTPRWIGLGGVPSLGMLRSQYDVGYLIFRICDSYADFWHEDLVARGEIEGDD